MSRISICSLILPLLLLTACEIAPVKNVEVKPAISIPEGVETKSVLLKKVIAKIAIGESIGQIYYGWGCQPGVPIGWQGGRLIVNDEEFSDVFRRELEKEKYLVMGAPSSVFEEAPDSKADILVGAVINKIQTNLCFPFSGSPTLSVGSTNSVKGGSWMSITWELYSRSEGKVLYKITTEGSLKTEKSISGGYKAFLLGAFSANIKNLLADPTFVGLLLKNGKNNNTNGIALPSYNNSI